MVVFVETSPSKKTVNVEPSPVNKKVVVSDVSSNQVVVQTSKNNNSVFISRKEAKNVYIQREGGGGLQVDSPTVNGSLLAGDTDGTYYWTQPYTHPVYESFDTNPDHIISQIKTNYKGHVIDIITKDPSTSSDVWDADENGLYYSNNVGIGGHSSVDAKLKVHGDIIATGGIMAYADDGSFGSIWDNIPLATKDSLGGVKVPHDETDTSTNMYIDSNGILQVSGDLSDLSQHSVTELNDVNSAGSGNIITSTERTNLNSAYDHISKTTNPHNTGFSNAYDYNITDAFFKVNEGNAEQDAGMKVHVGSNVYQLFKWDATNGRWYLDADVHVEGNITAANEISAYSSASTGDIWDDMPVATATSLGGVKVDDSISDVYLDSNDVLQISIPSDAGQWDSITGGIEYTGGNVNVTNGIISEKGYQVYSPNNKPSKSDVGLGNVPNTNIAYSSTIGLDDLDSLTTSRDLTANSISASGNVTISGDLTVNGTEFITNTETVEIEDNLAIINSGETGDGVSAGFAGWEADRGTLTNYRWGFDESSDLWKIGKVGDLQAVVTRPDSVTDDTMALWDDANNRLKFLARSNINLSDFNIDIGLSNLSDYSTTNDITFNGDTYFNAPLHVDLNGQRIEFDSDDQTRDWAYWYQGSTHIWTGWLDINGDLIFQDIQGGNTFEINANVNVTNGEISEQGDRVATRNWSTLQNVTEQGNNTDNKIRIEGGNKGFTTGSGLEMAYSSNIGNIFAYDRDSAAYKPMKLGGSSIDLYGGNVNITDGNLQVDGTGDSYFNSNLSIGKTTAASGVLDVDGNIEVSKDINGQSIILDLDAGGSGKKITSGSTGGSNTLELQTPDGNGNPTTALLIRGNVRNNIQFYDQSGTQYADFDPDDSQITFEYPLQVNDNIDADGEVTAYSSSDKRLKTNISDFTASELLSKMNPVTFNWNEKAVELNSSKDTNTNNFGLIAQELEEIAPELVHNIYNSDYKAIDYEKLIPILIQGWKEKDKKIQSLEKRINNIEKIIENYG